MFLSEDLLLLFQQALSLLGDLSTSRSEVLLFRGEFLLAFDEFAVPIDLSLKRLFLILEELHDLFLAGGDLVLAGGNLLPVGKGFRIPMSDLFLSPDEGLEPLREFLLPADELALLRQDLLPRPVELLIALVQTPFLLLKFLLPGPQAFLPPDERIPLVGERSPFLLDDPSVFVELRGLVLECRLALLELRVSRLQALFQLFQCVQRV